MLSALLLSCALLGQTSETLRIAPTGSYSIPWPAALDGSNGAVVEEERATRFLNVAVIDESTGQPGLPLLGTYRRENDRLVFQSRFKPAPDATFHVRMLDAQGIEQTRRYRVPIDIREPAATVTKIFPTTDIVPANLLKFYIHFSRPMREGRATFDRITLVDEDGVEAAAPWRPTELWNPDSTRLTLWIHPGRIKQGVSLREVEGPVLVVGKRYRLIVTTAMLDSAGRPLAAEGVKQFTVGPDDDRQPLLEQWRVTAPSAESREPLRINFPESLDRHLAERCIEVVDPTGKTIEGTMTLLDNERSAEFQPADKRSWSAGEYSIKVDDVLEDLAGNTPRRPFEVDLQANRAEPPPLVIRFQVQ